MRLLQIPRNVQNNYLVIRGHTQFLSEFGDISNLTFDPRPIFDRGEQSDDEVQYLFEEADEISGNDSDSHHYDVNTLHHSTYTDRYLETRMFFKVDIHIENSAPQSDDIVEVLTVTRTSELENLPTGWEWGFHLRYYHPSMDGANIPSSFIDSIFYRYYGLDNERAPLNTKFACVDGSAGEISYLAFDNCTKLETCEVLDQNRITTIRDKAFYNCSALRSFKFPPRLERIGILAFHNCTSLTSLFLPRSISFIGFRAFERCAQLSLVSLTSPTNSVEAIVHPFESCTNLFQYWRDLPQYQYYLMSEQPGSNPFNMLPTIESSQSVLMAIQSMHLTSPQLIQLCMGTDFDFVSQETAPFARCPDTDFQWLNVLGMTALHILCVNEHSTPQVVVQCFRRYTNSLATKDVFDMTPLEWLLYLRRFDVIVVLVTDIILMLN